MPLALVRVVARSRPSVKVTAAPLIGAPAASVTFVATVAVSPYCTLVAPTFVRTAAGGPKHLLSPTVHVSVAVVPLSLIVVSQTLPTAYSSVCAARDTSVKLPVKGAPPYFSTSLIGRLKTTQLFL